MVIAIIDPKNNLFRIGKQCYTEDKILIYTLYISNIPESVEELELKQYFSQFGEIESLTYKKKYKTDKGFRHRAIIQFKSAKDASKALRIRFHKVKDISLIVRGADSWIQPHKIRATPLIRIDDNDENYPILKLNDYCLFYIFSYLPFQNQVILSSLCDRFRKIFILMYKNQKFLKLNRGNTFCLSVLDFYESLTTIGKFVESIEVDCRVNNFHRIYDFILKFFPNLKKLHLENLEKKLRNTNKEIPLTLKKLTHLTLRNCGIIDEQVKKFAKLDRLEYLDLSENEEMTGKYLHKIKKLREICLNNCEKVETANLKPVLDTLPIKSFKVIGIRNADAIGSVFFRHFDLQIEELHFSSYRPENSFLKGVAEFKKIRKVRIHFTQLETNDSGLRELLLDLAVRKCKQLEYLGLISEHLHLTPENLDHLTQIKALKELEINRLAEADCFFWTKLMKLTSLEKLHFYCDQENFDELEFFAWIKKSKVQTIIAKFDKKIIKIDFVLAAIEILKELYLQNRKVKLTIYGLLIAKGTDGKDDLREEFNENILQNEQYLRNKHLINVILSDDGILDDEINKYKLKESQAASTSTTVTNEVLVL